MGVHAVGRAGHQGAQVLAGHGHQELGVLGEDDVDLVYLIGQGLAQDVHPEQVPHHQFIDVGEQPGAGQAPVAGEDRVGPLAPHGEGRPVDVPHRHLEDLLRGAVIEGQVTVDGGDVNGAHHAVAPGVKLAVVVSQPLRGEEGGAPFPGPPVVVGQGVGQDPVILLLVQVGHLVRVVHDGSGLVEGVPPVADLGISQERKPHQEHHEQKNS